MAVLDWAALFLNCWLADLNHSYIVHHPCLALHHISHPARVSLHCISRPCQPVSHSLSQSANQAAKQPAFSPGVLVHGRLKNRKWCQYGASTQHMGGILCYSQTTAPKVYDRPGITLYPPYATGNERKSNNGIFGAAIFDARKLVSQEMTGNVKNGVFFTSGSQSTQSRQPISQPTSQLVNNPSRPACQNFLTPAPSLSTNCRHHNQEPPLHAHVHRCCCCCYCRYCCCY